MSKCQQCDGRGRVKESGWDGAWIQCSECRGTGNFIDTKSGDVVCRGSYRLGTACGACRRCCEYLAGLLDELTDTDPCRYDHNDLCQEHNLHARPCPHESAKHALTTARHRNGANV